MGRGFRRRLLPELSAFLRFSGLRPLVSEWFGGLGGMQLLLLSTHKASKRLVPIAIAADRLG